MNIQIKKIFYGAILTPILEIIYSHSLRYFENAPKTREAPMIARENPPIMGKIYEERGENLAKTRGK